MLPYKNEELFGIGGEGCDVEIMVSSVVTKKRSKGTVIMSGCCTDKNGVLFEVGGEGVQQRESGLVIPGSSLGGSLRYITEMNGLRVNGLLEVGMFLESVLGNLNLYQVVGGLVFYGFFFQEYWEVLK